MKGDYSEPNPPGSTDLPERRTSSDESESELILGESLVEEVNTANHQATDPREVIPPEMGGKQSLGTNHRETPVLGNTKPCR